MSQRSGRKELEGRRLVEGALVRRCWGEGRWYEDIERRSTGKGYLRKGLFRKIFGEEVLGKEPWGKEPWGIGDRDLDII